MTDATTPDVMPTDANPGGTEGDKGKTRVEFTPEQQAEIDRIVAKEKRDAATRAAAQAKADRDAAEGQAKTERERKAAEERGEYDRVKGEIERERDAARTDLDAITAERDLLRAFFDGQVTAALKTMPDALKDFDPGPDAPFAARKDWLEKAQKRSAELTKDAARGNGANPPASNGAAPTQAQTDREMRARLGLAPIPVRR